MLMNLISPKTRVNGATNCENGIIYAIPACDGRTDRIAVAKTYCTSTVEKVNDKLLDINITRKSAIADCTGRRL